jgi:hypothetical protein
LAARSNDGEPNFQAISDPAQRDSAPGKFPDTLPACGESPR